jgi:hypothetical protein
MAYDNTNSGALFKNQRKEGSLLILIIPARSTLAATSSG